MNPFDPVSIYRRISSAIVFCLLVSSLSAEQSIEDRVQSWGGVWEFDGFDDGIRIAMGDNVEFRGGFSLDIRFKYLRRQPGSQLFHLQLKDTSVSAYLLEGSYDLVVDFQGPDGNISRHRFRFPGISDAWHHLTICLRRNQLAIAYLDGQRVQSEQEVSTNILLTTTSRLNLGGNADGTFSTFAGELDAVRFWNRMLNASEVAMIGDRSETGLKVQQLVDWTFESDSLPSFVSQAFDLGVKGDPKWKPGVLVSQEHVIIQGKTVNMSNEPIPHSLVELALGDSVVELLSDGNGEFMSLIPPGEDEISFHAFDGDAHAFSGPLMLDPSSATLPPIELRLGDFFKIEGFVRGLDKETPVRGAEVLLSQPGNPFLEDTISAISDLSGRYQFTGMPSGTYQISAQPLPIVLFEQQEEMMQPEILSKKIVVDRLSDLFDFEIGNSKVGKWKHFGLKDGMPSNRVEMIALSDSDAIWLANRTQLYHYDGQFFSRIQLSAEEEIIIASIDSDSSGNCWVGTQDGRIFRVDVSGVQQTWHSPERAAPSQLTITDKNELVLVSDQGLFRTKLPNYYQDDGFQLRWDILSTRVFHQLILEHGNPLWGSTDHGLVRFEEGIEILYQANEGLSQAVIGAIEYVEEDSVLFAQTAHALYRLEEDQFQPIRMPDQFYNQTISCIAARSSEELWMGTVDQGLWQWKKGCWVRFDMSDGLPSEDIQSVEVDQHGNVWIGTVNGFSRFNDRYWIGLGEEFGFQSAQHFSIAWDTQAERLVLGTEWSGMTELSSNGIRHFSTPGFVRNIHMPNGKPLTLFGNHLAVQESQEKALSEFVQGLPYSEWLLVGDYDPSGHLWVGRQWAGGGVMKLSPKEGQDGEFVFNDSWGPDRGLPNEYVWSVWAEQDDRVWFGTEIGIYIKTNEHWITIPHQNTKSQYQALDILERKSGEVWVATQQGIGTVVDGIYQPVVTDTLLDDAFVWTLFEDSEERLWIGTNSNGLFLYHQGMMMHYTTDNWLSGNSIYDIAESAPGELWFANEYGVDRHCSEADHFTAFFKSIRADQDYSPLEPLPSFGLKTRLVLDFDVLDVTCSDSRHLFHLDIRHDHQAKSEIHSVTLADKRFEWVPEKTGNYNFTLTAFDADLHASEPATLKLNVVPPWYLDLALMGPLGLGGAMAMMWGLALVVRGWRHRKEYRLLREQLLKQETSTRQNLEKVNEELKDARAIAEKAQKDAEIASEAKSLFLAKMSHEIRTPLNAVLGYSQMLKGNEMLSDQVTNGLSSIERSGQHLLKIINDILTLSKIESGHTEIQSEDFALSDLIDSIQEMVSIQCQEKDLDYKIRCSVWRPDGSNGGHRMESLQTQPPWPPLMFFSDLAKIRQVLLNLITNAVKFTHEGSITMEIRVSHPRKDESSPNAPFELYFSVEDTGVGMERDDRQRVFQAFEQGLQEGSGEHQGIGLGLAIANRLVEVLGGRLSCDSTLGKGSLFNFTIHVPKGQKDVGDDLLSMSKPRWKSNPPKALVVDDLEQNAKVLIRLLAIWGISCESVNSGQEAIDYLKETPVDILFMDIMMPKMSGMEAMSRIREVHGAASPKCIAYSAHVLEHERASYVKSSFDAILPKPIEMGELVQLIYTQCADFIQADSVQNNVSEPQLDLSGLNPTQLRELRSAIERYAATEIMRQIDTLSDEGVMDIESSKFLKKMVRAGDMKRILRVFDLNT